MARWAVCAGLILMLVALPAAGQQSSPKKPNELVVGKLVHVEPMPANLDQWMLEFLRRWGKYKLTGDPEGVDLVIRADKPEKPTEYEMRGGVPQPRGEGRRFPLPKRERQEPPAISISVIDWVTGEFLWHADILDRKPKKDEPEAPAGPRTRIFARGLTPDQLALKVTTKLREYVTELEKAEQKTESSKQ